MDDAKKIKLNDEALLAAEQAKPTSDPKYWSKRSCNTCYGRGIVGKTTYMVKTNTITQDLLCHCAQKNFGKWRETFMKEYKAAHQEPIGSAESVPVVIPESATVVDNVA